MKEFKIYLEDIEISPLKKEDIEDIVEMLNNPEVCRYLFFAPAPEEVYRGYFEPIAAQMEGELEEGRKPSNMVFILRERSSGSFIGQFGVMAVPMIEGVYEIGYQMREEYWGKGIGTFACEMALDYIFDTLKGHRAEANCYSTNRGSKKVLEKCGFSYEGELRGYYRVEEEFIGRSNYGLLKTDRD